MIHNTKIKSRTKFAFKSWHGIWEVTPSSGPSFYHSPFSSAELALVNTKVADSTICIRWATTGLQWALGVMNGENGSKAVVVNSASLALKVPTTDTEFSLYVGIKHRMLVCHKTLCGSHSDNPLPLLSLSSQIGRPTWQKTRQNSNKNKWKFKSHRPMLVWNLSFIFFTNKIPTGSHALTRVATVKEITRNIYLTRTMWGLLTLNFEIWLFLELQIITFNYLKQLS